jgi:hypothetical protein
MYGVEWRIGERMDDTLVESKLKQIMRGSDPTAGFADSGLLRLFA